MDSEDKPTINNPDAPATRQFVYDMLDDLVMTLGEIVEVNTFRHLVERHQKQERQKT